MEEADTPSPLYVSGFKLRDALLTGELTQYQGGVSATKTKGVRKGYFHLGFPGYIGHIVKVTLRVRRLIIDSRRDYTMVDSQCAEYRLY